MGMKLKKKDKTAPAGGKAKRPSKKR